MARLGHIDALRGLAALGVVVQHSAELAGLGFGSFNFGRFGIQLFFLLSGFVIPFSFAGSEPVKRFLISRFFRLYPAFWASLLAATLVSFVPPAEFAANATMAPILFGQPLAVGAYWTLFFELCFYALCILLFMGGMQTRYIGALAVVFLAWFPAPGGLSNISFIGLMLTGTLLRRATMEGDERAKLWAVGAIAVLVGGAGFTMDAHPVNSLSAIAALTVFMLAVKFEVRSLIFEWLGKVSYSLYLFQGVVLLALPKMPAPIYITIAIGLSIGIAAVSYRFIEAPANAFGRQFARRPVVATI